VAFLAGGGLTLATMTTTEMILTIGSGLIIAAVILLVRVRGPVYGVWPVALLVAFTALTALSVVWSVQPEDSFRDAGRMLAYSAFFAASVALVHAIPARWPAVLGGVTLAAAVVCGYALLTKVFPGQLDATDIYARLRAPYSYWNAIGLTAAMGAISTIWLGARRAGHALLGALAYPAMGLMLLTLMLAYSRGALVALALGLALWFAITPLRLRGAAVLLTAAVPVGGVVAWDFSTGALSQDRVALGARTTAGHELGALIVAMLLLLLLVGLLISFQTARRAPSTKTRRRAGVLLGSMLALAVLAFGGALAASHRGLTGSISHGFHTLTNPHAAIPPDTPDRLTAVGSVRARYWNEALKVFKAHPGLGAGAEGYATARLRYRTETLTVRHAHGYIVQTLADLGLVGLVLTLALFVVWLASARRCTRPFTRRGVAGRPEQGHFTPERVGMLSMLCLVVVFGIHSLIDWTWYVPGDACVALLCAGWLAGRGPLAAAPASALADGGAAALPAGAPGPDDRAGGARRASRRGLGSLPRVRDLGQISRDPRLVGLACAAMIAALLAAWTQWQPERSENASQQAIALLAHDPSGALAAAQSAVDRDPLSAQALITLATVQRASGHDVLARATLQRAVRLQPSNPQTWLTLGEYDLAADPRAALSELGAAIYLNPESIAPEAIAVGYPEAIEIQNDYVRALQDTTPPPRTVLNPPALSRLRAKGRATPGTPSGGRARKRRTAQ
jgi:hypothetical protein